MKMIGQRHGLGDVSIALNIYAHLAPNAQDAAATAIDWLLAAVPGEAEAEAVK